LYIFLKDGIYPDTMDQKTFTIVFVVIAVVAVLGIIISRMSANTSTLPTSNQTPQPSLTSSPGSQIQASPPSVVISDKKTYTQAPPSLSAAELKNKKAVIETGKGIIEFEILPEATKAASNFIFLSTEGFYDGLKFHRVEPGFVIQGGDPLGTGIGGPGYTFKEDKVSGEYKKGVVAMAKKSTEPAGTGGSQFFIMLADNALPPDYVIFGKVVKGQDVVSKIAVGDIMTKVTIAPLK
jgi:cyclophilin family peptidyl-prolyl cis-trans isomerase